MLIIHGLRVLMSFAIVMILAKKFVIFGKTLRVHV